MRVRSIGILLFAASGCLSSGTAPNPADGCTGFLTTGLRLDTPADLYTGVQPTSSVSGTTRSYLWELDLQHLCVAAPESQNSAQFSVHVEPGTTGVLYTGFVTAAVGTQPVGADLSALSNTQDYSVTIDHIGLLQGSQDGKHGLVGAVLRIRFTTKGSDGLDLNYLKSFLDRVSISPSFQVLEP